ncbi:MULTISPECIES: hypothetical protein [Luteibacter]|jgi:hypothetical protein|uniref:hypothetical protein n=1 Tax=Luteibacter TaxID=242605 RepID=UPI00055EAD24|nr:MULTISPECIES: hypothetical protein [unclassified Luteibacter]
MSDRDSVQHSSIGVGGSNNPAANPGQDKPANEPADQVGQTRPDDVATDGADQKGQRDPDKSGQR